MFFFLQLSHYLDVVEVSIARQISLRSEAFFHAMSSQHELQDQLQETQHAVAVLRGHTAAVDQVMCQGPLQALCTALTRNNCVKLHNKLKLMAAVHQTQPTVQLLLSTSEFVGALELIATTKEVLQQELQGIHSFRWECVYWISFTRIVFVVMSEIDVLQAANRAAVQCCVCISQTSGLPAVRAREADW